MFTQPRERSPVSRFNDYIRGLMEPRQAHESDAYAAAALSFWRRFFFIILISKPVL